MGILTHVDLDYNDDEQVITVIAVTKWGISSRAQLNRVAARAATGTGVGQRTLVAAAYEEEGIDLVWNKGLGFTVPLEEKFPDAQKISYYSIPIDRASEFGDITGIEKTRVPGNKLKDLIFEGINYFRDPDSQMHVWEIPYEVSSHK